MPTDPYRLYEQAGKPGRNGRELEGLAFSKAARLLDEAGRGRDVDVIRALEFNQRLWTVVQASVADTRNRLPDGVKANLLRLSLFMDKHARTVLQTKDRRQIASLVAINRTLADAQLRDVHQNFA